MEMRLTSDVQEERQREEEKGDGTGTAPEAGAVLCDMKLQTFPRMTERLSER